MERHKGDRKKENGVSPETLESSVQSRIAKRAYELYLERGGVSGHEIDNWIQAEREIQQKEHH